MFLGTTMTSISFSQKTDKEIKKDLSSKTLKIVRKEAKKLRKEGWDVLPGSLPLEKMLEKYYVKAEQEISPGKNKYIFAEGNSVGETRSVAEVSALTFANLNIARLIEKQIIGKINSEIANNQLNNDDAASVTQIIANSTELVAVQLGYGEEVVKISRIPSGNSKNSEVQLRICYEAEQSIQIAKKVIKKELKDKLKINEEQLNKIIDIQ
jgi:hypothetical protein